MGRHWHILSRKVTCVGCFYFVLFFLQRDEYIGDGQRWNWGDQLRGYCSNSDKGGPPVEWKVTWTTSRVKSAWILKIYLGDSVVRICWWVWCRGWEKWRIFLVFKGTTHLDGLARIPLSSHCHIWIKLLLFHFHGQVKQNFSFFGCLPLQLCSLLFLNLFVHHFPLQSHTHCGLWHLTGYGISPSSTSLGDFETLSEANYE